MREISPNTVYAPKEVAQLLRLSERTLRKLVAEGRVKGFRLGRQWRFYGRDLLALADDGPQEPHRS